MDLDFDSDSPASNPQAKATTVSPSDRISELNEIDASISTLLKSASTATSILSNQPSSSSTTSLSGAQASFVAAAQTYFSTLSSIEVRLRRQVYALEEAGLIVAGDERDTRRGRTLNNENEEGLLGRRSGGGPLDPSWLNARASEGVAMGMKREVLAKGKQLVEKQKMMEKEGSKKEDVEMSEND